MRLIVLSAFSMILAAQDPIALTAPIQKVRVHPDEAWITRIGKVHLPGGGTHRIQLKDLPKGLKVEDLQISATGPSGLRIGDLTVKSEPRIVKESAEWKKLEAEMEALRERRDGLEAQGEASQQELTFLKGLQAAHDHELSTRMTYATPDASAVLQLGKGVQERTAELLVQDRKRKRDLERLSREEARLNAEMKRRASEQSDAPSRLELELTARGECSAEVEVGYRSKDAHWRPHYEARLSQDHKRMDFLLYASVTQTTGDAWEGVRLEISNARPSQDLKLSNYNEGRMLWWTRYEIPKPVPQQVVGADHARNGNQIMYRINGINVKEDAGSGYLYSPLPDSIENVQVRGWNSYSPSYAPPSISYIAPPPVKQATESTAVLSSDATGLASTFQVEGAKDVPSDGEAYRFKVLSSEIEPSLVAFAAPRLDPTACLLARFKVPATLPLFAGASVVRFVGNQRLGESALVIPSAGQSFSMGFGPLRALRVALHRTDQKLETIGSFSKERLWTLAERIEISNDGTEPLDLEIQDRILKPASEQVKVSLPATFAPGWSETQPGVRTWTFKLEAGAEKKFEIPIQIRAPKDGFMSSQEDLKLNAQ
jgi:Domain of unknown function (DUF4139)/N-terminal domain of unknown function (DUF4140)